MEDRIVARVLDRYKDRAEKGMVKYGTTMDRNDLDLEQWLTHLQEELMDATVYIEKLKQEINYQDEDTTRILRIPGAEFTGPCGAHNWASEEAILEELEAEHFALDDECEGTLGSHPLCCTDYCPCKEEAIEKRMNIIGQ